MGEFFKYPHIDGLHKVPEIFSCEEIVATEKIHGTNFRVMFPAKTNDCKTVRFGSRNNEIGLGSGFYGDGPINWWLKVLREHWGAFLEAISCHFEDGHDVIIFGEWFGTGVHGGVSYYDGDAKDFLAFDVMVGGVLVDHDTFAAFCADVRLGAAPLVYRGKPSVDVLNALLEQNSIVAKVNGVTLEKNIAEGVVIRPTKMKKNHHDQWIMAKHKSTGFAEDNKGKRGPVTAKAYAGPHLLLAERYVTRGRLLNALDRAKENGFIIIQNSMADMQVLPTIVFDDVYLDFLSADDLTEEEKHTDHKALKSAVTRQTAIVYKALLNEQIGQAAE